MAQKRLTLQETPDAKFKRLIEKDRPFKLLLEILFDLENRLRLLEGGPGIGPKDHHADLRQKFINLQ